MTKEELKQEAKYYAKRLFDEEEQSYLHDMVVRVYMESAEPREKRIEELEAVNKRISDECHKLVDSLEKKQNENVDILGKIAFTENALNNEKAKVADLEKENAELREKCNSLQELVTYYQTNFCQE